MSLQWYEKHLQDIVKENQRLKFRGKSQGDVQIVIEWVKNAFKQLFPQIPMLTFQAHTLQTADQIIKYYKKGAQVWINMVNHKLEMYSLSEVEPKVIKKQKSHQKISYQEKSQIKESCLVCGLSKDRTQLDRLTIRIAQLQISVDELTDEIQSMQKQQEQYIKQISYLRSMVKQLEYELTLSVKQQQKIDHSSMIQIGELEEEISQIQKQANYWKSQFESVSGDKVSRKYGNFEEQNTLFNNLYREEVGQIGLTSTENSQLWVVQNSQLQSETHNEENKPPTAFSTSRPLDQFQQ